MRAILMTVMLIIAAITVYNSTVGGPQGTKQILQDTGSRINSSIENINP